MEPPRKRQKTSLTIIQKREICKFASNHKCKSHDELAKYFSNLWQVDLQRRTVGNIVKDAEKWDKSETSVKESSKENLKTLTVLC